MPVTERIAAINPDDIGRPTGAYRVELADHRGRVTERIDRANYVTPALERWVRWQQAAAFHRGLRYAHLGAAQFTFPSDVTTRGHHTPPMLPVEGIATLSSSVAVDEASDWATGRVIAYGTRWKSASVPAAGTRGQINEAQSEITLDGSKIVFDFNENQGNGEFGSLALCRVLFDTPARLAMPSGRSTVIKGVSSVALGLNSIGDGIYFGFDGTSAYGFDASTKKVQIFDMTTLPAADDDGIIDSSGLTVASESPALGTLIASTSNVSSATHFNTYSTPTIAKVGTDWVMAYCDGRGQPNIGKWNAAGTLQWATQAATTGVGTQSYATAAGLAIVGTDAYIVASAYSASHYPIAEAVYRVRLSDGVVTATYPLGLSAGGVQVRGGVGAIGGMTTDGTDLYVSTTEGILRMSTAGVILDALGDPFAVTLTESGVAPWSPAASYQGLTFPTYDRDAYSVSAGQNDRFSGGTATLTAASVLTGIAWYDGKLWAKNGGNGYLSSLDGGTAFSRALLDSPVTKTTSSTMKLTYEVTFPSSWRGRPTHIVPPS